MEREQERAPPRPPCSPPRSALDDDDFGPETADDFDLAPRHASDRLHALRALPMLALTTATVLGATSSHSVVLQVPELHAVVLVCTLTAAALLPVFAHPALARAVFVAPALALVAWASSDTSPQLAAIGLSGMWFALAGACVLNRCPRSVSAWMWLPCVLTPTLGGASLDVGVGDLWHSLTLASALVLSANWARVC